MINKDMNVIYACYIIIGLLWTHHGGNAQTAGECSANPRNDCYSPGTNGVTNGGCLGVTGCKWCPSTTPGVPWCIDGCDSTASAIDCYFTPTTGVTAASCTSQLFCSKYCTSNLPAGVPRCQVNYHDCLVEARVDAKPAGSTGVSKQSCLQNSPTGLWCPHGTANIPWCIIPQPAAARCYQVVTNFLTDTSDVSCRQNGGVWCNRGRNANRCIALPTTATASCTPTVRYQCLIGAVASPSQDLCLRSGCKWCPMANQPSCIHGLSTECIREQRIECGPGQSPTQTTCTTTLGCDYCPLLNSFSCIKKLYNPRCYVNPRTPCPSPSVNSSTTALQCASFGCLHCTDRTSEPRCIANPNPACTSCNCTTKTNCLTEMASTQANCFAKNCFWCPQTDPNIPNCIVFDNEGVSTKGVLSPCTVSCGGGSQFMYSTSCTNANILECPKILQVCNVQACPSNVTCTGVLRQRYPNRTSMCCETNSVCGIHSLSNPTGRRRKRVIAGAVTNSTWPWMGCIETGPTMTRCGAVLIKILGNGTAFALTSASCTATQFTLGVTQVRFATDSCTSGGALYTITGRTVLPGLITVPTDIALLTLSLVGSLPAIQPAPICLPNGEDIAVGSQCYLLGYGITDGQMPTSFSTNLREVAMTIQPFSVCQTAWALSGIQNLMESQLICAGSTAVNGAAACTGDLGGPLMCQRCTSCAWYLAGTATLAIGCGAPNRPSVFIRMREAETSFVRNQIGVEPLPEPTNVTFSCP